MQRNSNGTGILLQWAVGALIVCVAPSVFANLPLGGKTASMGGAGTAAGKDSAMPLINPAGFSQVPHHTLSLSASLYRMEQITVDDYFYHGMLNPDLGGVPGEPSLANNTLKSRKFGAFPGAATALWHFGDSEDENAIHHVLAFSMVVQSSINREFNGDFALRFGPTGSRVIRDVVSQTKEVTEYLFGPTYAINFGTFRLGTSVFLAYTDSVRTSNNTRFVSTSADYGQSDVELYFEGDVFGLQPSIGFQWEPKYGFALGVNWISPMLPLTGKFNARASAQSVGPPGSDSNFLSELRSEGDLMLRRPMRLRLGMALGYEKEWSAAIDGELVFPMDEQFYQKQRVAQSYQAQGAPVELERYTDEYSMSAPLGFNVHAGVEWYFNETIPLRLGGYYEKSAMDLPIDSAHVLNLDLDHIGASIGLGIESDLGQTTFGFQFDYGWGTTVASDVYAEVEDIVYFPVDVTSLSGVFYISGTFDLEEFDAIIKAMRKPQMLLGKERMSVSIDMVSAALATYANDPIVQPLFEGDRFSYPATGYEEFDELFERVAKMKAALVISTAIFEQMTSQVNTLKLTLDPKTDANMVLSVLIRYAQTREKNAVVDRLIEKPEVARLVELFKMGQAAAETLKFFGDEAAALPHDVQRLINKAQNDFVGPDMVLLPAVARNLGAAEKDAVDIVQQVPELLKAMTAFFAAWQDVAVSVSSPQKNQMLQFRMKQAEVSDRLEPYKQNSMVVKVFASDDALYPTVENELLDGAQKELTRLRILSSIGADAVGRLDEVKHTLKNNVGSTRRQKLILRLLYQLATSGGTPDKKLNVLGTKEQITDAAAAMALLGVVTEELHGTTARARILGKKVQLMIGSPDSTISNVAQIPFLIPVAKDLSQQMESTLENTGELLKQMEAFLGEVK